ncbi:MAG: T9SS type A sorting domain-containing protein [Bacteroidales bacterium]|nr:T9SS type A sorting domain-containing protein [Bacteroidales bacterium]
MKNIKIYALLALLLAVAGMAKAQSDLLWSEDYQVGNVNYISSTPVVRGIEDVKDYVEVTGVTLNNGETQLEMVTYDIYGTIVSTKTIGTHSSYEKTIVDYQMDGSENVYILCNERLEFYKSRVVLQKFTSDGDLVWEETLQNEADTSFMAQHLVLSSDGRLVLASYREYDYPAPGDDYIVTVTIPQLYCYDVDGNLLWQRDFDANDANPFLYDVFAMDGTLLLFGANRHLTKLDLDNNLIFEGTACDTRGFSNVQSTPDHHLLVTATMAYKVSKIDSEGNLVWAHDYGTNLPSNVSGDEIRAMVQDEEGNIYVTGRHFGSNYGMPNHTNNDILTLKYSPDGQLLWENRYAFGGNNADIGNALFVRNGNVYVGGESQRLGVGNDYDYIVLKLDAATGEMTGCYRHDRDDRGDAISSVYVFDDGRVAITGRSEAQSEYVWTTQLFEDITLYYPLIPKTGEKQWDIRFDFYYGDSRYEIARLGDEIEFEGQTYRELTVLYDELNYTVPFGLLREEGKKVYLRRYSTAIPHIMEEEVYYDFNLQVGDWFSVGDEVEPGFIQVMAIEEVVLEDGSVRNKYVFNEGWGVNPEEPEVWIEGIGSLSGIHWRYIPGWTASGFAYLQCYFEDDNLVWTDGECWDDVEEVVVESVSLYPNPASDIVRVKGATAIEVKIYNSLGQLVKTVENTNEINLASLPQGVYLLRIADAEGRNHTARVAVKE